MSGRGVAGSGRSRRWLVPHLGTVFFLIHVGLGFGFARGAFVDPGTGWHLATGRYILETRAVPHHDVFSFTAAGRPWIDYYWLFDLGAAALARLGGLPLFGAACLLVHALVPALLYRRIVRSGANPLAALAVMPVAYVVLLAPATARPLLLTYVFVLILLDRLDDFHAGRCDWSALWWTPLLVALWCNLHGGFAAGIALTAVYAGVAAFDGLVLRDPAGRRRALVLTALTGAMLLATLANPYGIELPLDIVHHLRMESTRRFMEFQSPAFHQGGMAVTSFELLVLALVATMALGPVRFTRTEVGLAIVTLHWALVAQRNLNLFVFVAAPMLARGLTPLIARLAPAASRRWEAIGATQAGLRSAWIHVPLASAVVLWLAGHGRMPYPTTLDDMQLTAGAARFVEAHLDRFERPFNTANLGGSLIYRFAPRVKVFVDDRTFVYGDDFVMTDYFTVFDGRSGWEAVLQRWDVRAAIVAKATPCATLLAASPAWTLAYGDEKNVIFFRNAPAS